MMLYWMLDSDKPELPKGICNMEAGASHFPSDSHGKSTWCNGIYPGTQKKENLAVVVYYCSKLLADPSILLN